MSYYYSFHFRAKLRADTPQKIMRLLAVAFVPRTERLGFNWGEMTEKDHPFFRWERAHLLPWGYGGEDSPPPVFRRYPHGGAYLEFRVSINYGFDMFQDFVDWLAPYIRTRFGRRRRGKQAVWVGRSRGESMDDRPYNYYVGPSKTDPRGVEAMSFPDEVGPNTNWLKTEWLKNIASSRSSF